jgi:hypothetical protein
MTPPLHTDDRLALVQQVARLDGVLHAAMEPDQPVLWIVRDPAHDQAPVEVSVHNHIAALGHDPASFQVRLALPAVDGPRRRVRFLDTRRSLDAEGVTIHVSLEWNDRVSTGFASGEKGPAIELKTSAQAAIHALEQLTGQPLGIRIIGVKQVHAFDSDIMVASLLRTLGVRQRLVGAVLVSEDPLRAAALSVLSALNRLLGNYLHTSD